MWIDRISSLPLPLVMGLVGLCFLSRKKDYFDSFLRGARAGLSSAVSLLPVLTALLVGIRMFAASGAVGFLARGLTPLCRALGVPEELLPLLLTRPFSGSGATATYTELLTEVGADSLPAFCASVIMGSSDTVVYIVGVYLSSVGAKKSRYTYVCAFAVMFFCIFISCFISRIWLNG